MPGFNGTGPMGAGPMTGRGQGYCNPSQPISRPISAWESGYRGSVYGQGTRRPASGRNRGFGRAGARQGRGFRG